MKTIHFLGIVVGCCAQIAFSQVKNYQINGLLDGQSLEVALAAGHDGTGRLHLLVHALEYPNKRPSMLP